MIVQNHWRLLSKLLNFHIENKLVFNHTISYPQTNSLSGSWHGKSSVWFKFHEKKFCTGPVSSLYVGAKVVVNVTVTAEMVKCFAQASGDWNPIHFDTSTLSAKSEDTETDEGSQINKTPVVHGALLNGIVSGVIGTRLPGPGTIVVSQAFKFTAPLTVGGQAVVEVEVLDLRRREVNVGYRIVSIPDAIVVMDGTARLLVPRGRIKRCS